MIAHSSRAGSHHREGSASVASALPERHFCIPEPSPAGSKVRDQAGDDVADAGRLVFIGVARHGLGTIAMPFLFRSFHGGSYGDNRA